MSTRTKNQSNPRISNLIRQLTMSIAPCLRIQLMLWASLVVVYTSKVQVHLTGPFLLSTETRSSRWQMESSFPERRRKSTSSVLYTKIVAPKISKSVSKTYTSKKKAVKQSLSTTLVTICIECSVLRKKPASRRLNMSWKNPPRNRSLKKLRSKPSLSL